MNGNGNGSAYPPAMPGVPQDMLDRLSADLKALFEKNQLGMRALQARSIGFEQNQLTNARIDALITSIAQAIGPQGPLWELQCRLTFEQHVAENIERAQHEGVKAQLSQGGLMTPEAIRVMARQTGTFGG